MKEDEHNISSIVDITCSWKNPLAFGTVAAIVFLYDWISNNFPHYCLYQDAPVILS